MEAAAHTKGGFGGVPQKVGKEFVKADKKMKGGGLYENINAKRERIAEGSGEKMRRVGSKGAPTADAFKQSAKTAKMSEGGKPDPLAYRIGANIVHKFPREGQTNMRNIPVGNLPNSPNAKLPEAKKRMDELRAERPERIKKLIKEDLGTHRKSSLPMKKGGKATKSCW